MSDEHRQVKAELANGRTGHWETALLAKEHVCNNATHDRVAYRTDDALEPSL